MRQRSARFSSLFLKGSFGGFKIARKHDEWNDSVQLQKWVKCGVYVCIKIQKKHTREGKVHELILKLMAKKMVKICFTQPGV